MPEDTSQHSKFRRSLRGIFARCMGKAGLRMVSSRVRLGITRKISDCTLQSSGMFTLEAVFRGDQHWDRIAPKLDSWNMTRKRYCRNYD